MTELLIGFSFMIRLIISLLLVSYLCLAGNLSAEAASPFAGSVPTNLGVSQGSLSPCPKSPNCVVSQNGDESHTIPPLAYQTERGTARATLLKVLSVVPRTVITQESDDYIRAESTSRLLGFVDDVEFYFPPDEPVIQMRSASRLGESDLGVNRRRLEQIRLGFQDLERDILGQTPSK